MTNKRLKRAIKKIKSNKKQNKNRINGETN